MVNPSTVHDYATATFLALEQIVQLNQQALEYLRTGQESLALAVLQRAVALLAVTAPEMVDPLTDGADAVTLPPGVALFNLAPIQDPTTGNQVPGTVMSLVDNGSFSLHHGLAGTRKILITVILYHAALSIHRGFCRADCIARLELCRSRDLYQACEASFAHVPELAAIKIVVDHSIGQLHTLFDSAAAA
jgi:hypothetical protein